MTAARALAQRPPWFARLPRVGDGKVAGAGMLVDEWHVVTCAHVVGQQVGQPVAVAGTGGAPEQKVVVEFPFVEGLVRRAATVVRWWPVAPDMSGDAAVLRLAEPVTVTPAPLACPPLLHGHGFWVHGFPGGGQAARQAQGRLGGASGPAGEWIQVESSGSSGWPVELGFSGAPVFDIEAGAVVGIVALRDEHRSGHLLPVSYLCGLWPWLRDRVGWRLDLDPDLKTHWLPRARGSEVESDSGAWYFTGRHAARQAVCEWLEDSGQALLVVAGGPGTGKSALLAHLLVASDPAWAPRVPTEGARPPVGVFDAALHVKGRTRDEVVDLLAALAQVSARTPQELLVAMRERHTETGQPFTVLVDAVEEAAGMEQAQQIARLLRELASTRTLRVLAGVRTAPAGTERARILDAFGRSAPRIDLEARRYQRNFDVADYVQRRLTGESEYYRGRSERELRAIARAIARKARYNFLIAQVASRWLLLPAVPPLDLARPAWDEVLPETIGEAMEKYLDAFGDEKALVKRLLTALAFARGNGLPRGRTWLDIADALHPDHAHTNDELTKVFHSAANYLVERTNTAAGDPAYRLYHDALDDHLRAGCPHREPQRAIVDVLRSGVRSWHEAGHYTRAHLAGHAAQVGQLDDLLADADFLCHAEPAPLLAVLSQADSGQGKLIAAVYRASSHRHRHADPHERSLALALDAARFGADGLQDRLGELRLSRWRVRFATGGKVHPANIATLTGHDTVGSIRVIAAGTFDGRVLGITGCGQGSVQVWDLIEQRAIGSTMLAIPTSVPGTAQRQEISALAVTEVDGRPVAVIGGDDGAVRIWDLTELRQIGDALTGHTHSVKGVVVTELGGEPVAVTIGRDKTVRLWNLAEQRAIGGPFSGHEGNWTAIAALDVAGRPLAVTADILDGAVHVWDLAERRETGVIETGVISVPWNGVQDLAAIYVAGCPVLLTLGRKTIRMWDLRTWRQIGSPLSRRMGSANRLATTVHDGRPVLLVCSDGVIQVWDLLERRPVGDALTGHTGEIVAVATTGSTALTGESYSSTLRMWDLGEIQHRQIGNPVAGHGKQVTRVAVVEHAGHRFALSASLDKTIIAWDIDEKRALRTLGPVEYTNDMAIAIVNDRPLAVVCGIGTLQTWDLTTGKLDPFPPLHRERGVHAQAVDVAYVRGNPVAAVAASDMRLCLWDLTTRRPVHRPIDIGVDARTVRLTTLDGRLVAVVAGKSAAGDNFAVRLWDLKKRREIGVIPARSNAVTALAIVDLGTGPAVVTSVAGELLVTDLTEQRVVARFPDREDVSWKVAAGSLNGTPIAVTAGRDPVLRIWDLDARQQIDEIGIPGDCHGLALGQQSTLVAACNDDIVAFDTSWPS
ncbi:trypsin-like peptidase domain-containing protein [Amycolatopsis pigmentata]|uniref:Trypsin-like peptidase domain-containing protein n=1 Tax=Amycolatopsis pigmentata TaxID=450801 RepID=A0ABW5G7P3_9PSEU